MTIIKTKVGNQVVSFASEQMRDSFLAARKEVIETLNFPVHVTSSFRTKEQNDAASRTAGVKSGGKHLTAEALDITFGVSAFVGGKASQPLPVAAERARLAAQIFEKHNFHWLGSQDIVHFGFGDEAQRAPSNDPLIAKSNSSPPTSSPSETEQADPNKPLFDALTGTTRTAMVNLGIVTENLDRQQLRLKLFQSPSLRKLVNNYNPKQPQPTRKA